MRPTPASMSAYQSAGRHHPVLKRVRAMVRSGLLLDKGPDGGPGEGEVLLETPNLIEDAIRSGAAVQTTLIRKNAGAPVRRLLQQFPATTRTYEIDPSVFETLNTTESNPGVLALAKAPAWKEEALFAGTHPLVVVLAGLQDPGNLGTILRAAEAFGASGVLTTKGTVSPFNAKVIRAASGTLFRLPLLPNLTAQQIIRLLQNRKATLFSSTAHSGKPLSDLLKTNETSAIAVALGSEGSGLPRELAAAGVPVSIPMASQVESLNVAVAASVLLYEIARLRQEKR